MNGKKLHIELQPGFPCLTNTNYDITSPKDTQYNCIAWAAGEDDVWWWPDVMLTRFWPHEAPRRETIPSFIKAFSTKGYAPCNDGNLENGFEKIALYALNGIPTHAAKQLPEGIWSSKLGEIYDISHTIDALDGPEYGSVVIFLKKAL